MRPFEVPWKYASGLIDAAIELNAAECFSRVYIHTSSSLKHVCTCAPREWVWHIWTRAPADGHCQLLQGLPFETWPELVNQRICILFLPPSSALLRETLCLSALWSPFRTTAILRLQSVSVAAGAVFWCWNGMFTEVFTFLSGSLEKLLHLCALEHSPLNVIDWAVWRQRKDSPLTRSLGSIVDGCCDSSYLTLLSSSMSSSLGKERFTQMYQCELVKAWQPDLVHSPNRDFLFRVSIVCIFERNSWCFTMFLLLQTCSIGWDRFDF